MSLQSGIRRGHEDGQQRMKFGRNLLSLPCRLPSESSTYYANTTIHKNTNNNNNPQCKKTISWKIIEYSPVPLHLMEPSTPFTLVPGSLKSSHRVSPASKLPPHAPGRRHPALWMGASRLFGTRSHPIRKAQPDGASGCFHGNSTSNLLMSM